MATSKAIPGQWSPPAPAVALPRPSRLVECFVAIEIVCQVSLLSGALAPFRVVFRTIVFAISIMLLLMLPGHGKQHPAARVAFFVMIVLGLSMLNPGVNNSLSAAAEFALYLAVLAPLFWVARVRVDLGELRRVLMLMWGFQVLSSIVGVLQVYFPAYFQFSVSTVVQGQGSSYLAMEHFQNAFGQIVYRPMGLTDTPGGAAAAGFFAVLFAAPFFVLDRRRWMQMATAAAMLVGMAAIYLSQVRVMLVMEVVCMVTFLTLMVWRVARSANPLVGRRIGNRRLAALTGLLSLAALGGFAWAVGVGGTAITERVNSLTSSSPGEVYQKNRGQFLLYTINDVIPEYPLGAGPGRWGMMFHYFGDPTNAKNPGLWAEIQLTAWIYDGGIPLALVYLLAIWFAFRVSYKVAVNQRSGELAILGAAIFAYDVGVLAATFDSCIFGGGGGLDFWMLNALLFNAAYHTLRRPRPAAARR